VDEETLDRQLERLAELVRVEVGESRMEELHRDLLTILEHFRLLQEVDTSGVEPTFYPLDEPGELRPDRVEPGLAAAEIGEMAGPAFDPEERVFVFQGIFDGAGE